MTNLNAYELNTLILALNDRESNLGRDWEVAQKKVPYGTKATCLLEELRELRRLADKIITAQKEAK